MSTTPTSPVPVIPTKPAVAVNTPPAAAQTWLQKHERLIIVTLVLISASWGLQHYLDNAALESQTKAMVAEQAKSTAEATVASNAATVAQVTQQYQVMVQTLTAQNTSLAQALAARQATVVVQQGKDAQLTPTDLSNRLQSLGNAPVGSVTVTPSGVALTQPAAVAVTQTLEQVAPLQDSLKDETTVAQNVQTELDESSKLVLSQGTQITDLNALVVTDNNACKVQVAAVKAEANKSKLKWFKRGFILGNVTGFIGGLYAGHLGL